MRLMKLEKINKVYAQHWVILSIVYIVSILLKFSLLTSSSLRHSIPPNNIHKTLTKTSRLQSDIQSASG